MTFELLLQDNMTFQPTKSADLIFCDFVYENPDFSWATKYWEYLKPNCIFEIMCDFHLLPDIWMHMKGLGANFVSHYVQKNEWGRGPSKQPHQYFDSILAFSKGTDYRFYRERIQVPKVTLTKGLNPSGRLTKTATAWIDDCTLTTTANERVIREDGHLQKWQKSLKLMQRLVDPYTDIGDYILDIFAGTATLGSWCSTNIRDYTGLENDKEVFLLAQKRLKELRESI